MYEEEVDQYLNFDRKMKASMKKLLHNIMINMILKYVCEDTNAATQRDGYITLYPRRP